MFFGYALVCAVAASDVGYNNFAVTEAAKSGKPIPKQSNIYEEIVKKGCESLKRSKK